MGEKKEGQIRSFPCQILFWFIVHIIVILLSALWVFIKGPGRRPDPYEEVRGGLRPLQHGGGSMETCWALLSGEAYLSNI